LPTSKDSDPINLTAEIVAAFVGNNSVPRSDLSSLIDAVHAALARIASGVTAPVEPESPAPAVSVRASIKPDYLICLDDGKKFKSLKRHLAGLGMTPDQYRAKWSLPSDYPMVAPTYAALRSALAKNIGLGQMRGNGGKPQTAKSKTSKPKRVRRSKASKEMPKA
jgi:predicted transcriptional regulator